MIQIDSTGTKVIDKMNPVIIAKPTEMVSGTNRLRAAPSIKNDGKNTARMQRIDRKIGTMVSAVPTRTAWGTDGVLSNWVWIFSMTTMAVPSMMPMARERP